MSQVERPIPLVIGVLLFLGSTLLGLVDVFVVSTVGSRWMMVVIVALNLGLAIAIWDRRNWARIVLLVLFIIGLLGVFVRLSVMRLLSIPSEGALAYGLVLTQIGVQAVALACFFSPSSNTWFRE